MIKLSDIKTSQAIVGDLDWPFDFCLENVDEDTTRIQLKPSHPFTLIAGDGTGGDFLTYGIGDLELLPILHGTSEGQAGKVAANLTEWLALMMAVPYWRDLLKFSGGGQLDEMRKTAVFMEQEYAEEFPDLPDARERIRNALPIPTLDDPIKVLHDNVHATDCVLLSKQGDEYELLFGFYKSSDHPNWR